MLLNSKKNVKNVMGPWGDRPGVWLVLVCACYGTAVMIWGG